MAPSIWNLQDFDNMSDDTSVHFLEFIWHTFSDQKLPIFLLLAGTADFRVYTTIYVREAASGKILSQL